MRLNLKRRHLNESQRGMVGARLATLRRGDNQYTAEDGQICLSQEVAANQLNVSVRTIKSAAAVQRTGAPELVAAVDSGEVSVSAAAEGPRNNVAPQIIATARIPGMRSMERWSPRRLKIR